MKRFRTMLVSSLVALLAVAMARPPQAAWADATSAPTPAQTPEKEAASDTSEVPLQYADFTWMNGQSKQKDFPFTFSKYVTPSLYLDTYYAYSGNHPRDNTVTGTASTGRHNEFQLNLASIGFDWNYRNVIGRISIQYGSMMSIVQDLDGTASRGRSFTVQNLRYVREATVGYHLDALHGINIEGGIFMSYMGLESYLLAENWNYSRSLVCESTPFYFQGVRAQIFPSKYLKIEPWLMNGWQTYGKWNNTPAAGLSVHWRPTPSLGFAANFYTGSDTRGQPSRLRFHHDHSVVGKLYEAPQSKGLSKLAISVNNHAGFESGGGGPSARNAHMLGSAVALRGWFGKDRWAATIRGEVVSNPSRYLAQFPPPGFAQGGGESFRVWGLTATTEYFVTDFFTLRAEVLHRRANVPFFAGAGGTTSPDGFADTATTSFVPDVVKSQTLGILAANFRL